MIGWLRRLRERRRIRAEVDAFHRAQWEGIRHLRRLKYRQTKEPRP